MSGAETHNRRAADASDGQISVDAGDDLEIILDAEPVPHPASPQAEFGELAHAHAAVVLARAQAAAARREEAQLKVELSRAMADLEIQAMETLSLTTDLETARQQYVDVDKQLAVEKTKLQELRKMADKEHLERLKLQKRLEELSDRRPGLMARLFNKF